MNQIPQSIGKQRSAHGLSILALVRTAFPAPPLVRRGFVRHFDCFLDLREIRLMPFCVSGKPGVNDRHRKNMFLAVAVATALFLE